MELHGQENYSAVTGFEDCAKYRSLIRAALQLKNTFCIIAHLLLKEYIIFLAEDAELQVIHPQYIKT